VSLSISFKYFINKIKIIKNPEKMSSQKKSLKCILFLIALSTIQYALTKKNFGRIKSSPVPSMDSPDLIPTSESIKGLADPNSSNVTVEDENGFEGLADPNSSDITVEDENGFEGLADPNSAPSAVKVEDENGFEGLADPNSAPSAVKVEENKPQKKKPNFINNLRKKRKEDNQGEEDGSKVGLPNPFSETIADKVEENSSEEDHDPSEQPRAFPTEDQFAHKNIFFK